MRNGLCYQPADLLPVVRPFPAGHEKAGQPMRWKALCTRPGCDTVVVQTEASEEWLQLLTEGQRGAFLAAFPKARFPIECPRHARATMHFEQRYAPPQLAEPTSRPMTEAEAFGESSDS